MTVRINLLPWRSELREKRKKAFITHCVIAGILGAASVFGVYMYYSQQLSEQEQANQMITAENAKLDEQLKSLEGLEKRRAQITERMKLIEGLQGQRPVIVRLVDEVVRMTPTEMYLTQFQRAENKFTFTGKAQDPNVVAEFLRNLEASPWFRNAFMNSYLAADDKVVNASTNATNPQQNAQGVSSLVQRPELSYGTFVVTVDLDQPKAPAPGEQALDNATVVTTDATGTPVQSTASAPAQPAPEPTNQTAPAPATQPAPTPEPVSPTNNQGAK